MHPCWGSAARQNELTSEQDVQAVTLDRPAFHRFEAPALLRASPSRRTKAFPFSLQLLLVEQSQ